MLDSVTVTFRGIAVEDLMSVQLAGPTVATVLGLGPGTLVSPFVTAVNDAAAAAAGVPIGAVYIMPVANQGLFLKVRLT